jgi:hypothetical protein
MKPTFVLAVGLVVAALSCASTPNGAIIMSNHGEAGTAQDDNQPFMMRPLRIAAAPAIDALKLVEKAGQPTLLYSTRTAPDGGPYELVIHAAPVADATRTSEVARISEMLPPPSWDARPVGDRYELLWESAGGAIGAIVFQDTQGDTKQVSVAHPFESFSRPHFVRGWTNAGTPDVGAVSNLQKVVVFPGGTTQPVKYVALAEGVDGVVGGTTERWVAAKSDMSGDPLFGRLPGRLTLSRVGGAGTRSATVPDFLAYELDAAPLGSDVVVFATSKPALLIVSRRPERPYRLGAEDRSWLLRLSGPTILVTAQAVHIAALVSRGSDQAFVLYGTVPIGALAGQ